VKFTDKKKLLLLCLCTLTVVGLLSFNVPRAVAQIEVTMTFEGLTFDGYIMKYHLYYGSARNASWGGVTDDSGNATIGQRKDSNYYYIYRLYLYFDTELLPNDVEISNITISLYLTEDTSERDFSITVQNGQPYYPHEPLIPEDYDMSLYSGNGGQLDTAYLTTGYNNITLNSAAFTWIDCDGVTKLCLRSSRDINALEPSTLEEYVKFATAESSNPPKLYITFNGYEYRFHGLYDEESGELKPPNERAVNITAYFTDSNPLTFTVNGSYTFGSSSIPTYFSFNLGMYVREYWLESEETNVDIYIFNTTLTNYRISFLDLGGVLDASSIIEAERYVNSTLYTVDKRIIDADDTVMLSLKSNTRYTIVIHTSSGTYTYGQVLFGTSQTITLTLTAMSFPKETLLMSKYVRIYGDRGFSTPTGNITITYQDTLNQTISVKIYINDNNGTNAYNTTQTDSSFQVVWANAENDTSYIVECVIDHNRYGIFTWRQYFAREFSEPPWGLDWMGSLPFDTSILLPMFLIIFAAGCFSVINAYIGAFAMITVAILVSYMGWISISGATLIVAFTFTLLMGIAYAKRRIET